MKKKSNPLVIFITFIAGIILYVVFEFLYTVIFCTPSYIVLFNENWLLPTIITALVLGIYSKGLSFLIKDNETKQRDFRTDIPNTFFLVLQIAAIVVSFTSYSGLQGMWRIAFIIYVIIFALSAEIKSAANMFFRYVLK